MCRLKEELRSKIGKSWDFFKSENLIFSNVYVIVITIVLFAHRIIETCSLSRIIFCKCFKDECCVDSRSSYGLNQVIPWLFFRSFHLTMCVPYCNNYCSFTQKIRLVPARDVHFFYARSHLRAPQNGHANLLTHFSIILNIK